MTQQDDITQRVLTDDELQALWDEACKDSPQAPGWNRHIRFARALLSKLRAPVADERAALQKLVDLEDMRLRLRALHENGHGTDYDHYHKALPAAWEAARAALASAPTPKPWPAEEQPDGTVTPVDPVDLASAPVAGEAVSVELYVYRQDNRYLATALLPIDTPLRPGLNTLYAAPQASAEDVRNAALVPHRQEWANRGDGYGHWVDVDEARFAVLAPECRRTLYLPQADKDGGQQKYWLCCGSKDPYHGDRRAPDCFNTTRAKWGTADQHSKDSRAALSAPQAEQGERDE